MIVALASPRVALSLDDGLEKDIESGHISYDPDNHAAMTTMRAAKVESIADFIGDQTIEFGPDTANNDQVSDSRATDTVYERLIAIADLNPVGEF